MACPIYGTSVITYECLDKNAELSINDIVSQNSIDNTFNLYQ